MAASSAIGEVSTSLRDFLTANLASVAPAPSVQVSDLSTSAPGAPPTVTLFLYEVGEDDSLRNPPPIVRRTGATVSKQRPPVALRLRYLLTVWADDHVSAHTILGRVIQLFHDEAIIRPPNLAGSLALEDHALKVRLAPLSLEDRTRVWNAVQLQYRLSVIYEVRVVRVESEQTTSSSTVRSRELTFAGGTS